jgi:hypothetical protein
VILRARLAVDRRLKEIHTPCEALKHTRRRVRPMSTEAVRICLSCGNEFSGAIEFCPVSAL